MQALRSAIGGTRLFQFVTNPMTRRALRVGRTIGLAGGIAYAGYGTGVHDALADPEGTTCKILEHVLVASGGGKLLPTDVPDAQLIQRLGDELVAAANLSLDAELADLTAAALNRAQPTAEEEAGIERVKSQQRAMRRAWRFVVIDDGTINAFVTDQLPGYVFVHRGLLELMKRHPEKLSFILGHELAHHLCDHNQQARNISAGLGLLQLFVFAAVDPTGLLSFALELGAFSTLFTYSLQLPTSRGHEHEADALGLQLVTRACRNPREAIKAHAVLASYEQTKGGAPDVTKLSSSHPATLTRLKELEAMLPDAEREYKKGGCWHRKEAWKRLSYTERLARAPPTKDDGAKSPPKANDGAAAATSSAAATPPSQPPAADAPPVRKSRLWG